MDPNGFADFCLIRLGFHRFLWSFLGIDENFYWNPCDKNFFISHCISTVWSVVVLLCWWTRRTASCERTEESRNWKRGGVGDGCDLGGVFVPRGRRRPAVHWTHKNWRHSFIIHTASTHVDGPSHNWLHRSDWPSWRIFWKAWLVSKVRQKARRKTLETGVPKKNKRTHSRIHKKISWHPPTSPATRCELFLSRGQVR